MPHIADAVEQYLLGVSQVRDVVGERVYQDVLRQKAAMPAIVLTTFGGDSVACLTGASAGLGQVRLQVECFASTKDVAWDLSEIVRRQGSGAGLQGYRGAMGSSFVHSSERAGTATIELVSAADASESTRWVATTDYLIYHAEAV